MFAEPKFAQGGFSIIFPRKPEIRRLANKLEDVLKGQYNQPTILGVPDDFEPEVPRLIFSSTHGFSQVAISQVSISLNVMSFSPDYQLSNESRRVYLEERVPLMFELLKECQIDRPSFVGLNYRVRIEGIDVSDEQILQKLSRSLLGNSYKASLIDIETKSTEIVEQKYYFNVAIANYRDWPDESQQSGVVRRPYSSAIGRGIQVLIDYNDRYAFNEVDDYFTTQETASEIITKAYEMAHSTLKILVKDAE
ncbi:MAG: hypothetical protein IT328_00180 [Caldilineaceae bacterium]|nr:hypothetical protein [Caldilineaceae bacterium]